LLNLKNQGFNLPRVGTEPANLLTRHVAKRRQLAKNLETETHFIHHGPEIPGFD